MSRARISKANEDWCPSGELETDIAQFEAVYPRPLPASIGSFIGLAFDADGTLYLTLASEILKRTPGGPLTRLAGSQSAGSADGMGSAASFSQELHIATTPDAAPVVADTGNNIIRRVSQQGLVTTIAGRSGSQGSAEGCGTHARFNEPKGSAVDTKGFIYVADTGNGAIRRIDAKGHVRTVGSRSMVADRGAADP